MNRIEYTLPAMNRPVRLLAPLLSLSLLACQAPQMTQGAAPATASAPASASAAATRTTPQTPKASAPIGLSARLEQAGQRDKIVFNLPRELFGRKGFRTQLVGNPNLEPLRYLRIFVTGPGISTPIESSAGTIDLDIDAIPASVTLANVPRGPNRVIVAQFYDDAMNPLDYAAPMGVYSSGGDTSTIQIRRQFSLLGRVILGLINQGQTELVESLDAAALQAEIDENIYTSVPPADPDVYAFDPTFIDGAALATEIVNQSGNFSGIDINGPSFAIQKSSLSLPVSRLVGVSGNLGVQVHAPFVAPTVVTADQTVNVSNIPPGNWRVTVTSQSYDYPNASFAALPLGFVTPDGGKPVADLGIHSFGPGATVNLSNLVLRPALSVNALTTAYSRTGQTLNLSGTGFHPVASSNTVSFTKADASPVTTNASSFAGSGETAFSVTVPALPEPGVYTVSVNGQSAGSLLMNVWMVSNTGSGNGLGWASASSLQNALANAGDGEAIWIKGGTYKAHASTRSVSFDISNDLTLLGGFDGTAIDGSRDPNANLVTLSGDLAGNDVSRRPSSGDADRQDNSYHVLQISSDTTLDGITIRGGHAYDSVTPPVSRNGGGILLSGSGNSLVLNEVKLVENHADVYGGGLMADNGTVLEISDGTIQDNSAGTLYGGGLYAYNATNTISGSTFLHNASVRGGGAAFENGSLTMTQTEIEDNSTVGNGGGIFVNFMTGSFDQCLFLNNQGGGFGGGIEVLDFNGSMNHSDFIANTAQDGGGMYQHLQSSSNELDLYNTGFEANTAASGGGLYLKQVSPDITSNAFGLNGATFGGGVYLTDGSAPVFRHCTIANNTASGEGRQISFENGAAPILANSVIWTGSGAADEIHDESTADATIQNSLVTGLAGLTLAAGSSNNLDADPVLINPFDPSGPDDDFGTSDDGLQVMSGFSAAINIGLDLLIPTDIRGQTRSGAPDAGAYEVVP